MKKLDFIPNENDSCHDIYNKMKEVTPSSFYEAKRTLEALQTIRNNPILVQLVVEEC